MTFKYSDLNKGEYDILSIKSECKFSIGIYNYTCLLHYISKCLTEKYIDKLYEDKKKIAKKELADHETIIYMALKLLESIKKIREYKDWINFYDLWLAKPRFPVSKVDDAEVNAEYYIYQTIVSSNITKEDIIKIHEEAYWLMLSNIRGLAASLADKKIECQFTGEFPYETYITKSLNSIITCLRDRYIEQTLIPLMKDTKGSMAIHLLTTDIPLVKQEMINNSSLVRRYVYAMNIIEDLCDSFSVTGIEQKHFEYIRVYRVLDSCVLHVNDDINLSYSIVIDMVDKNKGLCFCLVDSKDIPEDSIILRVIVKKLKKILMRCIAYGK